MTNATILIVEDEKRIAQWIQRYFENAGFQTIIAHDGTTGLALARQESPNLVVLDLMLPGLNGLEVCQRLRAESEVPIIMLTARDTQRDRVHGLDIGADDYIVKPFDPEELVARVKAVLRRVPGQRRPVQRVGVFELHAEEQQIYLEGNQLPLTAQQFALLATFMRNPNRVMTRERLITEAFEDFDGFDRAIDTHIRRLRRLIEHDTRHPQYIQTVYGAGYRFVPEQPRL